MVSVRSMDLCRCSHTAIFTCSGQPRPVVPIAVEPGQAENSKPGCSLCMQVLQKVDWQAAVAEMGKPLQLRFALVLLALYKAGEGDAQLAASQAHRWIWDLLQGPVGTALTSFAAQDGEANAGLGAQQVRSLFQFSGVHLQNRGAYAARKPNAHMPGMSDSSVVPDLI